MINISSATLVLRRTSADIPIRIISALNKAVIHELNETRSSLQVDHSEVALDRTESSSKLYQHFWGHLRAMCLGYLEIAYVPESRSIKVSKLSNLIQN